MPTDEPRSRQQRVVDARARLEHDVDVWVATAGADGSPYLVPLSFAWNGEHIIVSAERKSRTIQSMERAGIARLGLGTTRDVIMIDVQVKQAWSTIDAPKEIAEGYAQRTGWDPRQEASEYAFIVLEPRRIQAWREANELRGRLLMRDGAWLND